MVVAYILVGSIFGFLGFGGALLLGATVWASFGVYVLTGCAIALLSAMAFAFNRQKSDLPFAARRPQVER